MLASLCNNGLGLLGSTPALAAVIDAAAPAALLLSGSESFSIGTTQLPWRTVITQLWYAQSRQYNTQQQQRKGKQQQQKNYQWHGQRALLKDDVSVLGFPSSVYASNNSRNSGNQGQQQAWAQQPKHHTAYRHKDLKQRHWRGDAGSKPVGSGHAAAPALPAAVSRRPTQKDSSHRSRQQQQQHVAELPSTLGSWGSSNSSVSAACDAAAVSERHLMALIKGAHTISDMEHLLLQHHAHFRYNHVSAAVCRLPLLQPDSSYNSTARLRRLTSLISSGLIPVAHQLDLHQITACLRALTTPVCSSPLQVPALDRLMNVLLQDEAHDGSSSSSSSKLWKLHSNELADLSCAAAVIQRTSQQQQQQIETASSSSSSVGSGSSAQALLEASSPAALAASAHALEVVPDSSSSSGALALLSPLQRLWTQLRRVVKPQLDNFSAGSLSLLLHGFVSANKADDELLLLTTAAALARAQKFEDPEVLTCMLQALAMYSRSSSSSSQISSTSVQQLLASLSSILARHKSQFSSRQLICCVTALAHLQHFSEEVCLAACKVACRTLRHWQPDQVADLLRALVRFRYRDELLLKAVVKQLPHCVGSLSVAAAADVLVGLLQLNYRAPDVGRLVTAVLGDLAHRSAQEITPSAAAKLLWVTAVMEESSTPLQQLLLGTLEQCSSNWQQQQQQEQQLGHEDLLLLYQAHRLITDEWLLGNKTAKQQQQQQSELEETVVVVDTSEGSEQSCHKAEAEGEVYNLIDERPPVTYVVIGGYDDDSDNDSSSSSSKFEVEGVVTGDDGKYQGAAAAAEVVSGSGLTLIDLSQGAPTDVDWPPAVLAAARKAAAAHASSSIKASRQLQQHIQDLFEEMGLEAPVQGFRLDGGALQPDLAFVAHGEGLDLKVALMCDHDGRYTCNAPFQLVGYDTVEGWLLEKAGWKVVRLRPHEWHLILQDDRVHEGSALAFLYNTLATQGIPL